MTLRLILILVAAGLIISEPTWARTKKYKKATDLDNDVVKNKLFPKKKKVEISLPNVGAILNQSYVSSFVFHGSINYFWSEEWGIGAEALFASNTDKNERTCIENFFNDPKDEVASQCDPDPAALEGTQDANYGPAYVPIREINQIFALKAIWNPIYGKQLFFLTATGYFDLYVTVGAGLTMSTFYEEKTILNNGNRSRGPQPAVGSSELPPGAAASEADSYGIEGRPEPLAESHPTLTFGVGQKFHFFKRFNLKFEIRNYTLIGTASGFDTFFAVWGGAGLRL